MERSRTNNPPTRLRAGIAALGVAMSFAIGTGTVHAAGTASGTSINNLSTLNYSVGGIAQPAIGSSPTGNTSGAGTATTFVVDNRVNVTVTTTDATFVPSCRGDRASDDVHGHKTGNTVQDFALASAQAANGTRCSVSPITSTPPRVRSSSKAAAPPGYQVGAGHRDLHRRTGSGCDTHRVRRLRHSRRAGQQRQRGRDTDRDGACGWRCGSARRCVDRNRRCRYCRR